MLGIETKDEVAPLDPPSGVSLDPEEGPAAADTPVVLSSMPSKDVPPGDGSRPTAARARLGTGELSTSVSHLGSTPTGGSPMRTPRGGRSRIERNELYQELFSGRELKTIVVPFDTKKPSELTEEEIVARDYLAETITFTPEILGSILSRRKFRSWENKSKTVRETLAAIMTFKNNYDDRLEKLFLAIRHSLEAKSTDPEAGSIAGLDIEDEVDRRKTEITKIFKAQKKMNEVQDFVVGLINKRIGVTSVINIWRWNYEYNKAKHVQSGALFLATASFAFVLESHILNGLLFAGTTTLSIILLRYSKTIKKSYCDFDSLYENLGSALVKSKELGLIYREEVGHEIEIHKEINTVKYIIVQTLRSVMAENGIESLEQFNDFRVAELALEMGRALLNKLNASVIQKFGSHPTRKQLDEMPSLFSEGQIAEIVNYFTKEISASTQHISWRNILHLHKPGHRRFKSPDHVVFERLITRVTHDELHNKLEKARERLKIAKAALIASRISTMSSAEPSASEASRSPQQIAVDEAEAKVKAAEEAFKISAGSVFSSLTARSQIYDLLLNDDDILKSYNPLRNPQGDIVGWEEDELSNQRFFCKLLREKEGASSKWYTAEILTVLGTFLGGDVVNNSLSKTLGVEEVEGVNWKKWGITAAIAVIVLGIKYMYDNMKDSEDLYKREYKWLKKVFKKFVDYDIVTPIKQAEGVGYDLNIDPNLKKCNYIVNEVIRDLCAKKGVTLSKFDNREVAFLVAKIYISLGEALISEKGYDRLNPESTRYKDFSEKQFSGQGLENIIDRLVDEISKHMVQKPWWKCLFWFRLPGSVIMDFELSKVSFRSIIAKACDLEDRIDHEVLRGKERAKEADTVPGFEKVKEAFIAGVRSHASTVGAPPPDSIEIGA